MDPLAPTSLVVYQEGGAAGIGFACTTASGIYHGTIGLPGAAPFSGYRGSYSRSPGAKAGPSFASGGSRGKVDGDRDPQGLFCPASARRAMKSRACWQRFFMSDGAAFMAPAGGGAEAVEASCLLTAYPDLTALLQPSTRLNRLSSTSSHDSSDTRIVHDR